MIFHIYFSTYICVYVCVCVCVCVYIYIYLSLLRLPKKYHKLGCLNSRHLFLLVMKVGKFMTKVWVGLVFSEGSVPVPSVLKWWSGAGAFWSLSYKGKRGFPDSPNDSTFVMKEKQV